MGSESEPSKVCQMVMLDGMRVQIEQFLATQGWECHRAPFLDDEGLDALPTYLLTPSQALMDRSKNL